MFIFSNIFFFQNLVVGIKQISEFLGFSLTDEQVRTISAQCTFQAMRENSQETHGAIGPFLFRKGKAALICGVLCQPHTEQESQTTVSGTRQGIVYLPFNKNSGQGEPGAVIGGCPLSFAH